MNRGDKVRPTARVIAANPRFANSTMTVRLAKTSHSCSGCLAAAMHEERDGGRRRASPRCTRACCPATARGGAGELYAPSKEVSTSLCLRCVEPV